MAKATLVATLTAPPSPSGEELVALPQAVQCLEVRADLVGAIDPTWLRNHFPGRLLYTLRSRAEGGSSEDCSWRRLNRLRWAARHYDFVDLEGERDLLPNLLAEIPYQKRLISWHGPAVDANGLRSRFEELSTIPAQLYKLEVRAEQSGDELVPLSLLKSLRRSDITAFATGQSGFWSRLVAPHLGAPIVFGSVEGTLGVHGEPSIWQLIEDYGFPDLPPVAEIYGIVGNPVAHSLSPRLHNAAYRALRYPALYVPFHVESFTDFWCNVVQSGALERMGMLLRGLTVASPHKETALTVTGTSSDIVQRASSTNLFLRTNGIWTADTTDPEGILLTLGQRGILVRDKRVAVVGCGGSGRAVAAALDQAGAKVTLVNRGVKRGHLAVQLLGLPFIPLSAFTVKGFSIVVNATSVGRDHNALPFEVKELDEDAVVVDLVYGSTPTPLATKTRSQGRIVVDGREVLLTQVRSQFHLMTGRKMPGDFTPEPLSWGTTLATAAAIAL